HRESGSNVDGGADLAVIISGGDLVITPAEVTLDVTSGGASATQVYVAKTMSGVDVSAMAAWTVDDPSLGSFGGATFAANTIHGGTTYVRASWQGMSGFATIHVKLHATISDTCPGCPAFPPDSTPACTAM